MGILCLIESIERLNNKRLDELKERKKEKIYSFNSYVQ